MEKQEKKQNKEALKWKKIAKKINAEKDEYLNDLKRAKADLVNYKSKEIQRMKEVVEREKKEVLLKVIDIFDNFERATIEIEKQEEKNELMIGFLKVKEQMEKMLKEEGVVVIKAVGEEFNPHYHEAVDVVEDEEQESGTVLEEVQKGYLLNDKIIRSSKVRVVK
jgi:molecular chaperone GrpE